MEKQILSSTVILNQYCCRERFKGYSLYDSHNSFLPFERLGKTVSFYVNQIIKRSPLNLRPILGIKKAYNPKGMGLFLNAYSTIKKMNSVYPICDDVDRQSEYFYNWLINNYSRGYSGYCWGYHYDWPKKDGSMVSAFTPSSVVTGFNARALMNYYQVYKKNDVVDVLQGCKEFILNDLPITENKRGVCISYVTGQRDLTVNANLLAGEVLAYADKVSGKNENESILRRILEFTINHQNLDGSWYYSFNPSSYKPKKQIDFHQGYVLESIFRICTNSNLNIDDYKPHLIKGLKYYRENQFTDAGTSYWRYPKRWPVDIHNQSQGIITFSVLKEFINDYFDFAERIAQWTIKKMQGAEGNFYYQQWPLFSNQVSYMRWNQAWMLLALTTLLDHKST